MKRTKQIFLAIMITACIILLVWLFRPVKAETDFEQYIIASEDIDVGQEIVQRHFETIELPAGIISDKYKYGAEPLIGRVASFDISAGELISSNHVTDKPQGLTYPNQKTGTRLMTIELPASFANGYWLAAGSLVDIDMIAKSPNDEEQIISLENIEVVAVLSAGGMEATSNSGYGSTKPLICIALTREQALQLADGLVNRQVCISVICVNN